MLSLMILAVGLTIVIGGILRFRLHAFIALILAGLTVAILTPPRLIERAILLEKAVAPVQVETQDGIIHLTFAEDIRTNGVILQDDGRGEGLQLIGRAELPKGTSGKTVEVSEHEGSLPDTPLLLFVPEGVYEDARQAAGRSFTARITSALGEYCGKLAILIVAASVIGRCLLDSGAADRIVRSTLSLVGERLAPAAFVASGFVLGIPVFFDTVFYLMIPLGKALHLRTGRNYLLYVLAIVAGGTMAHSLVPPTPGPLFIAEEFGVDISSMIVGGCIVGLLSSSVGMLYAFWINRRCELPLRDFEPPGQEDEPSQSLTPGLVASLVPVILPVILITLGSLLKTGPENATLLSIPIPDSIAEVVAVLSEKNLALLISAGLAIAVYLRTKKPSREQFSNAMQKAVSSAGTIILVTAAGGAFGRMMRQTGVAELLQDLPQSSPVMLVTAAFFVTTAVRTAQGSATVAMFTSAGVFGGIIAGGAAGVDPLYVALAVGCGSKPVAWMNDSGFWVITRMSGMTESEGLKYVTPMTAIAGLAGLAVVLLGVIFFP